MTAEDRAIRRVIIAGLLLAITLLLTFTRVGLIPMPTPAANATIAHIPAIIAGILEGPVAGLLVGLGFGFSSFMAATIPMFRDPLVAVLPRLFIGLTAAWTYRALRRANRPTLIVMLGLLLVFMLAFSYEAYRNMPWLGIVLAVLALAATAGLYLWMQREDTRIIGIGVAAAVGSLTNTVLVLTVATLRGYIPAEAAWGIGLTHGIPEVIVAGVVTIAVVAALRQVGARRRPRL
ncbi:MAG: ECF transporter S component [Anaerolineae bacterium]|jgi:uncharacterized membrane protein